MAQYITKIRTESGDHQIDYNALANLPVGLIDFKRSLTSADDIDNIKENGVYVYRTDSIPQNAPFQNAAVILVFGSNSTSDQNIQFGIRYGNAGKFAFRALYGGSWHEWTEISITGHNHDISDITNGTLSVAQGGTGKATHTSNAVLTGNGTSAVKNVATASGALYATAANGAAKFGTLPIAQGGTGATTAAKARANIGAADVDTVDEIGTLLADTRNNLADTNNNLDQTANAIYDLIDDLRTDLKNTTKDYITVQGTSGIWTYRKWNSGVAECWGKTELKAVNSTTAWGSLFYGDFICNEVAYPFSFTARPTVSATPVCSGGDLWLCGSNSYPGNQYSTPRYYPITSTSKNDCSACVDFYVIGKWK